ncbi:MAG: lysine--tRNA ligase, partial [Candidatus Paceibacteria bacterium]
MLEDILRARREKLEKLKKSGIEPFPEKSHRSLFIGEALKKFSGLSKSKRKIVLAGRLIGLRYHGGVIFGDLKDASATIQVLFRRDILSNAFELLQYIDIGDFIEVEGVLFTTKAGEKTLESHNFSILVKTLRPLPSSWYGLEDIEERFRKRYLDILMNSGVYERFSLRSKIVAFLREFLSKNGFIEVETPILQTLYGGALAKPFRTQLDILHLPLYLRIAPELYLKRLLVAGFEKIYELGRVFRNEGIDREHNPEFTMLELYWAYQDRDGLMKFCETLFSELISSLKLEKKKNILTYQGREINFAQPWKRVSFFKVIKEAIGLEYEKASESELMRAAEARGLKFYGIKSKGKIADEVFKKLVVPEIKDPTFVIDHPVEISP